MLSRCTQFSKQDPYNYTHVHEWLSFTSSITQKRLAALWQTHTFRAWFLVKRHMKGLLALFCLDGSDCINHDMSSWKADTHSLGGNQDYH